MAIEPVARTAAGPVASPRASFSPLLDRLRRCVEEQPLAPPASLDQGWRPPAPIVSSVAADVLLSAPARVSLPERIATRGMANGPSSTRVELRVTPEFSVTVGRSETGVTLHIDAAPLQVAPAEAVLPRLVAALRIRGLTVAHANVRVACRRPRPR